MTYRTLVEAKQWIIDEYGSITNFAKQNQFSYAGVQRVLTGVSKCYFGEGKAIAEMLKINPTGNATQEKTPTQ